MLAVTALPCSSSTGLAAGIPGPASPHAQHFQYEYDQLPPSLSLSVPTSPAAKGPAAGSSHAHPNPPSGLLPAFSMTSTSTSTAAQQRHHHRQRAPTTNQPQHSHYNHRQTSEPTLAEMFTEHTGAKRKRSMADFGGLSMACILADRESSGAGKDERVVLTPRRMRGSVPEPEMHGVKHHARVVIVEPHTGLEDSNDIDDDDDDDEISFAPPAASHSHSHPHSH